MRASYVKRFIYMGDAEDAAAAAAAAAAAKTGEEKKFTQADFNKAMADFKRGLQDQNQKLSTDLQAALEQVNMTTQQKEEFQARFETLNSQHLTETQRLAQENDKWKKKYEKDTVTLGEEGKQWRGRFESMMITNAIVSGAVQHKGLRPEQFVDMLSSKAKVVADVDADGKPTGTFSAKLPVKTVDPKSKETVIVDLPVAEAIAKMKADEGYFNLFEEEGKGGLGGGGNPRKKTGNSEFHKGMSKEEFGTWFKQETTNA